jgi:hypothetical protein
VGADAGVEVQLDVDFPFFSEGRAADGLGVGLGVEITGKLKDADNVDEDDDRDDGLEEESRDIDI